MLKNFYINAVKVVLRMSKENKYRTGIDERPLTKEELDRLKKGEGIYERIAVPKRPEGDIKLKRA